MKTYRLSPVGRYGSTAFAAIIAERRQIHPGPPAFGTVDAEPVVILTITGSELTVHDMSNENMDSGAVDRLCPGVIKEFLTQARK